MTTLARPETGWLPPDRVTVKNCDRSVGPGAADAARSGLAIFAQLKFKLVQAAF